MCDQHADSSVYCDSAVLALHVPSSLKASLPLYSSLCLHLGPQTLSFGFVTNDAPYSQVVCDSGHYSAINQSLLARGHRVEF